MGAEVESRRRGRHSAQQQGGVAHVAAERSDLVQRAGKRDDPVAAHPAVRGLEANRAGQRGGLADGAARVRADPNGAWNAATAAAEPPLQPPGTRSRSHGLAVGPVAENSVDEPIANSSMLVLPGITAPASRSRSAMWASYGLS